MTPQTIDHIGFAAATCTTGAFLPQLVRVIRLRSAKDISLATYLLFSIGLVLWTLYGISIRSTPVIASNTVTLALALGILGLKLRYDRNATKELTKP